MAGVADSIITPQTIVTGTLRTFNANPPANGNYDNPGVNFRTVLPGQPGGQRITRVWVCLGSAARPAGDIQLYTLNAGTIRLIRVIGVTAINLATPNLLPVLPIDFGFSDSNPLFLGANEALIAGQSVLQPNVNVRAEGAAYADPALMTANSIITPQRPITGTCKLFAAGNGDYTFPVNTVALLDPQANGARITKVQATPGLTTVAGDVELYASPDGVIFNHIMTQAVPVVVIGAGNVAAVPPIDFGFSEANPLYLAPGESLRMGLSSGQQSILGRCEGGGY